MEPMTNRRTIMATPQWELEGTWEEIAARGPELAGRRVRLIVLDEPAAEPYPGLPPAERPSTAGSLLKYAGTWVGDDLEECLKAVYANRTKSRF
jgi:hypothetical protein